MLPRFALTLLLTLCAHAAELDDALLAAARKGDLAQVQSLLASGASVEAKTRYQTTPLYFAARNGHFPVVELLLAKGANPNITDTFYKMHILVAAAEKGGIPVLKALLAAGSTPPPNFLPMAAAEAAPDILAFLIEALKPSPDTLSAALQTARVSKNEANAAILLKAGAKTPELKFVTLPPESLARFAGSYSNDMAGVFTFAVRDGKLAGGPPGQSLALEALDESTFVPTAAPTARLVFSPGPGPAAGFTLTNSGQTLTFKRTESKP